ncbi:MAG TPA: clostripain-related cysteine peptidase, partial [Acidobacteriota bacterium]
RSETEAAEDRKNPGKRIEKKYLTASQLRGALSKTKLATKKPEEKPKKIDILGLDACSMSMAELASELGDYVEFMVASQDDVPDQSFPYEDILRRLKDPANANDPSKASTMIPELYREAYRDYITDPRTGFRAFTLSVVDLGEDKMKVLRAELKKLAGALLQLSSDPTRRHQIFEARKSTQGFVFGLFVDIVDLCDKLDDSKIYDKDLTDACAQVRQAVKAAVIENQVLRSDPVYSADKETPVGVKVEAVNGLSIYFPYRIPNETEQLQELRKGSGPLPAKGSGALPAKERSLRIKELEQDLTKLRIFQETGWNDFIRKGWSSILASEVPTELDEVYSGQQCAQNLGSLHHHGRGMGRAA